MKRVLLGLAAAAALISMASTTFAQAKPEFQQGFKALADVIPQVVGEPLENEHYGANGDSLQRTTTGLMVWRKADNWTAFTDGYRTWINGPLGVQERGNDERLSWESAATPTPTPSPTAVPTPSPTATPVPPTPTPQPKIAILPLNVIQGAELERDSVWVMGEIRNDGPNPAYNVVVTGRLLSDSGSVVGSGTTAFPYLGPGDTVGYRVTIRNPSSYARAEVSTTAADSYFSRFDKLYVAGNALKKSTDSYAGDTLGYEGSVINKGQQPLSQAALYVWYLDDWDRVVWADFTFPGPGTLNPGDSASFDLRTARSRYNTQVTGITQVRFYSFGVLP